MMVYKPTQTYEPLINEDKARKRIDVIFEEIPEKLVANTFRAMGFKMLDDHRTFRCRKTDEMMDFALLMQEALREGELPRRVHYEPSFEQSSASLDRYNFSVVTVHYDNSKGNRVSEQFLIFERLKDACQGFGWLIGWGRHQQEDISVTASYRSERPKARSLLEDGKIEISLPEPFGSYDKKSNAVEAADQIKEDQDKPIIALSTVAEKPSEQIARGKVPVKLNDGLNDSYTSNIQKTNGDSNVRLNARAIMHGEENTGNLERGNESEETVTGHEHLPENATNESHQKVEVFLKESIKTKLPQSNFELLLKLIPNLERELKRGVKESESYQLTSKFQMIRLEVVKQPHDTFYAIKLALFATKEKAEAAGQEIDLGVDFTFNQLQVWGWKDDGKQEDQATIQQRLKRLFEQVIGDGHQFALEEEVVSAAQNNQKSGKMKKDKVSLRCVQFYIGKDEKDFKDWDSANKYLATIDQDSGNSKISYCISWANYSLIKGRFELYINGNQPQFSPNLIGTIAFKELLKNKYTLEGRHSKKVSLSEKRRKEKIALYETQLQALDFGIPVRQILRESQPKIPIESIKIQGINDLSINQSKQRGFSFKKVNDKLEWFVKVSKHEETITIRARWKDGKFLFAKLHGIQIPEEINPVFWRHLLKRKFPTKEVGKYQCSDKEALLFEEEYKSKPSPHPRTYSIAMKDAYWNSSDEEEKNQIKASGYAFHYKRLVKRLTDLLKQKSAADKKKILSAPLTRKWFKTYLADFQKENNVTGKLETKAAKNLIQLLHAVKVGEILAQKALLNLIGQLTAPTKEIATEPTKRVKTADNSSKEGKPMDRLQVNRKIEALMKKKGTTSSAYTSDEKQLLAKYSGYGNSGLKSKGEQVQYAFYTPEDVIIKMWALAFEYGFKGGNILEPACGTGRFIKYLPEGSKIIGYETDPTAVKICQILYPKATIHNEQFENYFLKKRFRKPIYDLVIGNPPFGQLEKLEINAKEKEKTIASTYDQYFLMRGVDVLKPDGLLIYIMPATFLMNSNKYKLFKALLASKAKIKTMFRLPDRMFKYTGVTTDILVLQKRKIVEDEK